MGVGVENPLTCAYHKEGGLYHFKVCVCVLCCIVQGFLRVAPSRSEGSLSFADHLHFLSCLGCAAHESVLLGGVVFPRTTSDPVPSTVRRSRDDGSILVALFDISLAGDLEGGVKTTLL